MKKNNHIGIACSNGTACNEVTLGRRSDFQTIDRLIPPWIEIRTAKNDYILSQCAMRLLLAAKEKREWTADDTKDITLELSKAVHNNDHKSGKYQFFITNTGNVIYDIVQY